LDITILLSIIVLLLLAGGIIWFLWQQHVRRQEDNQPIADKALFDEEYFSEDVAQPQDIPTNETETFSENEYIDNDLSDEVSSDSMIDEEPRMPEELIIGMSVKVHPDHLLSGADVLSALEHIGLIYGDMKIYHNYGVEKNPTSVPVFSVANLVEPGTLNPHEFSETETSGVMLFMQLPGPIGGRVAFELMLHHAQRLAELLSAQIFDERHQLVSTENMDVLRQRIAQFES